VRPSHLLDTGLWRKLDLEVARDADAVDGAEVIAPTRLVRGSA
jgi:hypothetical protein